MNIGDGKVGGQDLGVAGKGLLVGEVEVGFGGLVLADRINEITTH